MADFRFDEATHTFTLDGKVLPSVTGVLKDMRYIDDSHFPAGSADLGRAFHKALALRAAGKLDWSSVDDRLLSRITAIEKFEKETGFKAAGWETPLRHPIYNYAGIPDTWGVPQFDIRYKCWWLLDYKTGAKQWWMKYQLAAYEELLKINNLIPKDMPLKRFPLELKDDGTYRMGSPLEPNPNDLRIFLAGLAVMQARRSNGN